jgi:hypothetical protein
MIIEYLYIFTHKLTEKLTKIISKYTNDLNDMEHISLSDIYRTLYLKQAYAHYFQGCIIFLLT